jgi:hypothetical protein
MEAVRVLAAALWNRRGCPEGDDWTDWFAAERMARAGYHECHGCKAPVAGTRDDPVTFRFEQGRAHRGCVFCERFLALAATVAIKDADGARHTSVSYRALERLSESQVLRLARRLGYRNECDRLASSRARRAALEDFVTMGAHAEHKASTTVIGHDFRTVPMCARCAPPSISGFVAEHQAHGDLPEGESDPGH